MRFLFLLLLSTGATPWRILDLPASPLATSETATHKPLPATMPGGFAILDTDNDGLLDLYFPNSGRLLRNRGQLRFEPSNATPPIDAFGVTAGDYDADGRTDLLVTTLDGIKLFRNTGNGHFTDVTAKAGLSAHHGWTVAAAWADIDNDGDLDLFVTHYVVWDSAAAARQCLVDGQPDFCHPKHYAPTSHAVFENRGNGTFKDISQSAGFGAHKGKGMSVAAADFDADGYIDFYVTNDRVFNQLFLNRDRGKRFVESAFEWGIAAPLDGNPPSAMGTDTQDYDHDGRPDIIYTALRDETFPLYRNTGSGFAEVTASSRMSVLSRLMAGWGIVFADLDNDGSLDLAAARSDALAGRKEPPSWFHNLGDGRFEPGPGWDALPPAMWRGALATDLDNDGCLDMVFTALKESPRILRNPCEGKRNNWLQVDVREPGARIRVGKQWRFVSSSTGYASSYAGSAHFGLGNGTTTDVEVHWPGGASKQLKNVAANQRIRVVRP